MDGNQYEIQRGKGVGENILDKTTGKDSRGGTGIPKGYKSFSFYFI